MASIELYIDKQLCETESPENFSVYLKRQLLNPAELNTKDAQRSYGITLPATATNNAIFGYTNTEEVKGKFSHLYDAQLLMGGIKIFDGKFKVSEITKQFYKGNLGVPVQKTIKEIFGDKMMNQAGEWAVPFNTMTDISLYNEEQLKESEYCFFPLALHSLLPKSPDGKGYYSNKDMLDASVRFDLKHFPPSINCLEAVKKIFENENPRLYISGSAFDDERLKKLFMSYKNPESYVMPWNYGQLSNISLSGKWSNLDNDKIELVYAVHKDNPFFYTADMLHGTNNEITIKENPGKQIKKESHIDNPSGKRVQKTYITIPEKGLYKLEFKGKIKLDNGLNGEFHEGGKLVLSVRQNRNVSKEINNNFLQNRFELKVLRYGKDEETKLDEIGFDDSFYANNLPQTVESDPKYFPEAGGVNFVDVKQNPNLLCGLSFGKHTDNENHQNPTDTERLYCNAIAKRHGKSWDEEVSGETFIATKCPRFYKSPTSGDNEIELTPKYTVNIDNTPFENRASRNANFTEGEGQVCQIVWFEQGDRIEICSNSDLGFHVVEAGRESLFKIPGWVHYDVEFDLSIKAFRNDKEWLTIDSNGTGSDVMDWNDKQTFMSDNLDLIKFLPSNIKINDWLDNFCKAFNLSIVQTNENSFELNSKQRRVLNSSLVIDLDKKTDVNIDRRNTSLNLPATYEIGFTVDKKEQGFEESKKKVEGGDDGGGRFETGSMENTKIEQKSNFSYNWLKTIRLHKMYGVDEKDIEIPVIGETDIWKDVNTTNYAEEQKKSYTDKAQRFWYKKNENFYVPLNNIGRITTSLVSNRLEGDRAMELSYKNEKNSIFDNYFTLLTDAENAYTVVECYLTPDEYNNITNCWIKLNGDIYYVAEVDGYDPLCKKKTTLKLIRRML